MNFSIQNYNIILIVIGVGLILIGLVGGGLEIKELKIPKVSIAPRIGISLLGVILLLIGIMLGLLSDVAKSNPMPSPTPNPTSAPAPNPTSTPISSSSTWKAIINSSDTSTTCGDYVANSGHIYLVLDVSLVNLSSQDQVLSDDLLDLKSDDGGHYQESQCANPTKQWSVSAGQPIHLTMVFIVPDTQSCFTLSILDADHTINDEWYIGCT
jgi:hypothetical protein